MTMSVWIEGSLQMFLNTESSLIGQLGSFKPASPWLGQPNWETLHI